MEDKIREQRMADYKLLGELLGIAWFAKVNIARKEKVMGIVFDYLVATIEKDRTFCLTKK